MRFIIFVALVIFAVNCTRLKTQKTHEDDVVGKFSLDLTGKIINPLTKEEAEQLKADNANLKGTVLELTASLESLKEELNLLKEKVQPLPEKVANLEFEQNGMKEAIMGEEKVQNDKMEEMYNKLTTLDGQVAKNTEDLKVKILKTGSAENWVYWDVNSVYIDVDFSDLGLDYTPTIFTSVSGDSEHHHLTGSNSLYSRTNKGFRVYIYDDHGMGLEKVNRYHWKLLYIIVGK